jgi:hypothetical protein
MPRQLLSLAITIVLATMASHSLAQTRFHPPDDSPVVRAAGGDYGLFFRFGGLGTMTATGERERNVNNLLISQVGLKIAFSERWLLPIFLGTGLRLTKPSGSGESRTDWGTDAGAGFEYHFRIWRRISPFVGANLELGFNDPSGSNNFVFSAAMGPQLGVEYYFGDRVSLTAQYEFLFRINYEDSIASAFSFATQAGGILTLTYYF